MQPSRVRFSIVNMRCRTYISTTEPTACDSSSRFPPFANVETTRQNAARGSVCAASTRRRSSRAGHRATTSNEPLTINEKSVRKKKVSRSRLPRKLSDFVIGRGVDPRLTDYVLCNWIGGLDSLGLLTQLSGDAGASRADQRLQSTKSMRGALRNAALQTLDVLVRCKSRSAGAGSCPRGKRAIGAA